MKRLISIIFTISILFIGCNNLNSNDEYITKLKVGDTLDISIQELFVKQSTEKFTKYFYSLWNDVYRIDYYISVDLNNKITSIWTKKR